MLCVLQSVGLLNLCDVHYVTNPSLNLHSTIFLGQLMDWRADYADLTPLVLQSGMYRFLSH